MILELKNDLSKFIDKCSIDYFNEETDELINRAKENKLNADEIAKEWEKLMKEVSDKDVSK